MYIKQSSIDRKISLISIKISKMILFLGVSASAFIFCANIFNIKTPQYFLSDDIFGGNRVSAASINPLINYTGRLKDASNVPLEGNYNFTFSFYDAVSGGNVVWTDTWNNVPVRKGYFNLKFGSGTVPLNGLDFSQQYYLGVKVNSDPEMSPLVPFTPAPYAFFSAEASHSLTSDQANSANYANNAGFATNSGNSLTSNYAQEAGHATSAAALDANSSQALQINQNKNDIATLSGQNGAMQGQINNIQNQTNNNQVDIATLAGQNTNQQNQINNLQNQSILDQAQIGLNKNDIATLAAQLQTGGLNFTHIEYDVATLAAQIMLNTQDILNNKTNIILNTANILLNKFDIATNSAQIEQNKNDIAFIKPQVSLNTNDIATISSKLDNLTNFDPTSIQNDIATIAANLDLNVDSKLATLAAQTELNTQNILNNSNNIANNTQNIATNSAQILLNQNNITLLKSQVSLNITDIATLAAQVFLNSQDLSILKPQVAQNSNDILNNNYDIATIAANLDFEVDAKLATMSAQINQNTQNITNNALDISTISAQLLLSQIQINQNTSDITFLKSENGNNKFDIATNSAQIALNNSLILLNQAGLISHDNRILALENNPFHLPQDIYATSSPTFNNLNLSNNLNVGGNATIAANLSVSATVSAQGLIANDAKLNSLKDSYGNYGTTNQVLSTDSTGKLKWMDGIAGPAGSGSGTVNSVNNNFANSSGNVTLTAGDVGSYTQAETNQKIGEELTFEYIPATKGFERTANSTLGAAIYGAGSVQVGKYVYMAGGFTTTYVNTFQRLNLETNLLESMSVAAPAAVHYSKMTWDGQYLYMFGGYNGSVDTAGVYRYNLANMSSGAVWEALAPLPAGRHGGLVGVYNNSIYYLGGGGPAATTFNKTIYKYNISANSWSTLSTLLPTNLVYSNSVQKNNLLYIVGGTTAANIVTNSFQTFDMSTETLTSLNNLPINSSSSVSLPTSNGILYLSFGNGAANGTFGQYYYDFTSQIWSTVTQPTVLTQSYSSAGIWGNRISVLGGYGTSAGTNTLQTFTWNYDKIIASLKVGETIYSSDATLISSNGTVISPGTEYTATSSEKIKLAQGSSLTFGWVRRGGAGGPIQIGVIVPTTWTDDVVKKNGETWLKMNGQTFSGSDYPALIGLNGVIQTPEATIVKAMAANNLPSPQVASATTVNSTYQPHKAFDGDTDNSTGWSSSAGFSSSNGDQSLYLDMGVPVTVRSYSIESFYQASPGYRANPNTWDLMGSNDGTSWSVIDSQAGISGWVTETKLFQLSQDQTFRHLRIRVTKNNGDSGLAISQLKYFAPSTSDSYTLPNLPQTNGQFQYIKAAGYTNTGTFESGTQAGQVLTWNGTNWVASASGSISGGGGNLWANGLNADQITAALPKIGIGTNDPQYALDVRSTSFLAGLIVSEDATFLKNVIISGDLNAKNATFSGSVTASSGAFGNLLDSQGQVGTVGQVLTATTGGKLIWKDTTNTASQNKPFFLRSTGLDAIAPTTSTIENIFTFYQGAVPVNTFVQIGEVKGDNLPDMNFSLAANTEFSLGLTLRANANYTNANVRADIVADGNVIGTKTLTGVNISNQTNTFASLSFQSIIPNSATFNAKNLSIKFYMAQTALGSQNIDVAAVTSTSAISLLTINADSVTLNASEVILDGKELSTIITTKGDGTKYLADDGTYKTMTASAPAGTAKSVNNNFTDANGNITLGAHDVDAYTQAETDQKIGEELTFEYMPATPGFTRTSNTTLATAIRSSGSIQIGKYVYMAGGYTTISIDTFQRLNLETNLLENMPVNFPLNNQLSRLVWDGTYIYSLGGANTVGITNMYRYKLADMNQGAVWEPLAPLPAGRYSGSAGIYNGSIYYLGGQGVTTTTYNNSIFKYNIVSNTWSTLATTLPTNLSAAAFAQKDNLLYFAGGLTAAGTGTNSFRVFDMNTETFSSLSNMPVSSSYSSFILLEKGLLYSSFSNGSIYGAFGQFYYDFTTQQWTTVTLPSLAVQSYASAAAIWGNKIVLYGGFNGTVSVNTLQTFDWNYDKILASLKAGETIYSADATLVSSNGTTINPGTEYTATTNEKIRLKLGSSLTSGWVRRGGAGGPIQIGVIIPTAWTDDVVKKNGETWLKMNGQTFVGSDYPALTELSGVSQTLGENITAKMTSNTAPAGSIVSSTSLYSSGYEAYKAFDKDVNNGGWVAGLNTFPSSVGDQSVTIQIPVATSIRSYRIWPYGYGAGVVNQVGGNPKDWTLQGSNDGTNWDIIHTVTNAVFPSSSPLSLTKILPQATTAYSYYKINITEINGANTGQFGELELLSNKDTYTLPTLPANSAGQFQYIKAAGFTSTGAVPNGTAIGQYLAWDGNSWVASSSAAPLMAPMGLSLGAFGLSASDLAYESDFTSSLEAASTSALTLTNEVSSLRADLDNIIAFGAIDLGSTTSGTTQNGTLGKILKLSDLFTISEENNALAFNTPIDFNYQVNFMAPTTFATTASFLSTPVFATDSAGTIVIPVGSDSATYKFSEKYNFSPYISLTPADKYVKAYWLDNITPEGFTVQLETPAAKNLKFHWLATQVAD